MSSSRFLILAAVMVFLSPLLRASVSETNTTPCTYKVVVVKQYIFVNSSLTSCPTFQATVSYGGYLSIENYYQSSDDYTIEIRYETQYAYYTPATAATFSTSLIQVPFATSVPVTTATVTIASGIDMSQVSFSSTNTQRFQLVPGTTDTNARTISFSLIAMSATPDSVPSGDANVRVNYGQSQSCLGPAVVCVKPTTQEHAVGGSIATNYSASDTNPSNPGGTLLTTMVQRDVAITVKDQFGVKLTGMWNGPEKVDEQFDSQSGYALIQLVASRVPIREPDADFTNGIKIDRVGWGASKAIPVALTSTQAAAWVAGNLAVPPEGYRNTYQLLPNPSETKSGGQKLWVWGTELNNVPTRTITVYRNHPASMDVSN
jgi:hypothetical protein